MYKFWIRVLNFVGPLPSTVDVDCSKRELHVPQNVVQWHAEADEEVYAGRSSVTRAPAKCKKSSRATMGQNAETRPEPREPQHRLHRLQMSPESPGWNPTIITVELYTE